jgi:hypothetical protein
MRPLTIRERKLIKQIPDIIAGKPMSEALRNAGFSETTAKKQQKRIVGKSRFQAAMQQALEKAGIFDKKLTDTMKEGLEATKVISVSRDGEGMKLIEFPDYAIRQKYLETAHKLRGDFPSEKKDITLQGNVATNVIFEVAQGMP